MVEDGDCSHYMKDFYAPHVPLRLPKAKKLLSHINKVQTVGTDSQTVYVMPAPSVRPLVCRASTNVNIFIHGSLFALLCLCWLADVA